MIKIGQKYNLLTVIAPSPKRARNGGKFWVCQCDCGNIVEVRGDKIQSGHTKSCGCLNTTKRIKNIQGKRYGKLTVLEATSMRKTNGDVIWKCQCDCGTIVYATKFELDSHRKISCGCAKSLGELKISEILTHYAIDYKKEFCFSDLRDQGLLRFDFAVFKNQQLEYLIEFDGELHFGKSGWNGKTDTELIQKHDKMKNEYCKQHQIPLIRIPYYDIDSITIEDVQPATSKYLLNLTI